MIISRQSNAVLRKIPVYHDVVFAYNILHKYLAIGKSRMHEHMLQHIRNDRERTFSGYPYCLIKFYQKFENIYQ